MKKEDARFNIGDEVYIIYLDKLSKEKIIGIEVYRTHINYLIEIDKDTHRAPIRILSEKVWASPEEFVKYSLKNK